MVWTRGAARSGSRRQRRTNWLSTGVVANPATMVVAPGASATYTLWDQNPAVPSEPSVYVDPVLTRLRGDVVVDYTLPTTAGAHQWYVFLAIVLYQSLTEPFVASSDNILWTKLLGQQYNVRAGGADQAYSIVTTEMHNLQVDVKAQRKMGDLGKLMLYVANHSSSTDNTVIAYHFRGLFKE